MQSAETKTWEQYQHGLAYQKTMRFHTDFPMFIAFKEGDQWPAATERTRNLPRPVFNIVKMFIRTKRSSILNQPVSINYTCSEVCENAPARVLASNGAKDFTDYARQLWRVCEQERLNEECLDDAATLGTGILHYYYDSTVRGNGERPYVGEIRGETLDPLNVIFGNPQDRNVQSQPYIIMAQRRTVDDVREFAKTVKCRRVAEICGDDDVSDEGYTAARHEMEGTKKCTLLTKYYRKDGIVYFSKSTKNVDIVTEQCLTPEGREHRITLYPIAVMNWEIRKKCIFGIGETADIIPTQKAINFLKAMEILGVQQTAWPKIITKPHAIEGQTITNEPGEHLEDHYQNGNGIYYLNPPAMSVAAANLVSSIFDLQRTVSGVSEVSTGEPIGASIAASAIIALQNQAKTPIEEIQKRFYRCIKAVGRIWEELIKTYYHTERNITVDSPEIKDEADRTRPFTGTAYAGCEFDLQIDVGASSEYGEVLSQATLDKMWERGDITTDEYIELAPHNVIPFKEKLKQMRAQRGADIESQLLQLAQTNPEALARVADMVMNLSQAAMPANPLPEAQEPGTPGATVRPSGVGGIKLPAIPKAPGIPALGGGE